MCANGHPPWDWERIEFELRNRLENAKSEYQRAMRESDRLSRNTTDLGLNEPGGRQALQPAKIERSAIKRYSKALQDFTRFVLDGEIPKDLRHN